MTTFLGQCACGCKLTQKLKQIGGDPNCSHDFKPIPVIQTLSLSTKEYHHRKRFQDILDKTKTKINIFNQQKEELDENFKRFASTVENEINEMMDVLETRKKEMLEVGEKQYNSKKEEYESQLKSLTDYELGCEECLKKISKIFEENTKETLEREEQICQISDNFDNENPLPEIYNLSNTLEYIIIDENKDTLKNDILKYGDIPQNEDPKRDYSYQMQKLHITNINQTQENLKFMDDHDDINSMNKSTTSSNEQISDNPIRMSDKDITTPIINEDEDDTKMDTENLSDKFNDTKREKSPLPSDTASATSYTSNQTITLRMYRCDNNKKREVVLRDLNIGWDGIKKIIKQKCKYTGSNDFNLIVSKGPNKDTLLEEMQHLLDLQNLDRNYLRIDPIPN